MKPTGDTPHNYPMPGGARLLVKLIDESDRHPELFLPENVEPYPDRAYVTHVGPGYRTYDGYLALEYEVGDEILVYREKGVDVEIAGERYLLVQDNDVLVILSGPLQ